MYELERRIAIDSVREAAELCLHVQNEIAHTALEKQDRSPVTIADFGSQALVCRRLSDAFPDDPIIAEEGSASLRTEEGGKTLRKVVKAVERSVPGCEAGAVCGWIDRGDARGYADRFWTLDPIDGTKGFLRQDQFAVALALIEGGEVVVVALACPRLKVDGMEKSGVLFAGVKGEGTTVMPLDLSSERPVSASEITNTADARFCESVESGHSDHSLSDSIASALDISREPIRIDSQAKYALVAVGAADIYLRLPTRRDYVERIWDHAAGALVIAEAGGRVTDINGAGLDFTHGAGLDANKGIIATNGALHDRVLEAVQQAMALAE